MTSTIKRRDFLGGTAAVGLGVLSGYSARAQGANDRVVMGIIGSGGMGRNHMNRFKEQGVEWAAVCDVWDVNQQKGLEIAGPKAKGYLDYRPLLDRKDVDAVLIATPEHWHHDHLINTVHAGKDAYCEKPMSWSIEQGFNMVREVRKTDRIVQIGMQRRSSPIIHECKQLIDSGLLGEVNYVRAEWWWNVRPINPNLEVAGKIDWDRFVGPAPKQAYDPIRFRYWRLFWDFSGGNMTDQGTHLLDVVQWMMNSDKPVAASSWGAVYKLHPAETPDTFSAIFEYPKFMCTWTLTYTNSFEKGWAILFQGRQGTLELCEDGYRIYGEPWSQKAFARHETPQPVKQNLPGSVTSTAPHTQNFLECIKMRKQPNAPVEVGHTAVRPLHLANIAQREGRRVTLEEIERAH